MISEKFPEVKILRGDGNLFWTAAINMGIRHALDNGAHYILTLNDDTHAPEDFLAQMLKWTKEYPDSLFGALAVDSQTGIPHYGGEIINPIWNTSRYYLDILSPQDQKGLHEVSVYPARGLLIPRVVFDKIGLFDEKKFPHYFADFDFTRLAIRNGFKVYCNYDAKLLTYPDEGGNKKILKKKTLRNYYLHLFGIKGGGNLKNFTLYSIRHSHPLVLPYHLLRGYCQRIISYFLK
jgi:GT2 family glycosyltransferase